MPVFHRVSAEDHEMMYDFYQANADDPLLQQEFAGTLAEYASPLLSKARAEQVYDPIQPECAAELCFRPDISDGPIAIGWLTLSDQTVESISGRFEYRGINIAAFVSEAHRGKGIGSQLMEKLVQDSHELRSTLPEWGNRNLWTGIRPDNVPSQKMMNSVGFKRIGLLADSPQYDFYVPTLTT
ncbi:MAG: GNAT family N-acetyltransferase [Patescibacteria group bacterium]